MSLIDDMLADPTHYMHGTTKGWQLGCTCPRCAAKTAHMRDCRVADRPKRRRWTEEDDERLAMLLDSGFTVPQIGKAIGRTRGAVSTRLAERGLRVKRRSGGWTDEEVETLILLRGEGLSARQVGEAIGRSRDASATTSLTHILTDTNITYENGAVVRTGFVTNMGGDVVAEACPELHDRLEAVCDGLARRKKKKLPKYEYPDEVITSSKLQWMAGHGTSFQVRRADCERITRLDSQGAKSIFGGGLLLSERAAAERAAAYRWTLSERERARVRELGR